MSKITRKQINEVSAELARRAEQKQRELLKDEDYLKNISAWKYIKSLKRADDFKEYADKILGAIEDGNEGSPDEQPIDLSNVHTDFETVYAVSIAQRKRDIKATRLRLKGSVMQRAQTIIPQFDGENDRNIGVYSVIYKSSLDNELCGVWVDARSIKNAIKEAQQMLWDMAEIVEVKFEGKQKTDTNSTFEVKISTDASQTQIADAQKAGAAVAAKLTNGEFNNMKELVADCHDDETTAECPNGNMYEGVDVNGAQWSGKKASYRKTLDENNYTSLDDFDVPVITKINQNGNDLKATTKFNTDTFRLALTKGIIHFVFTKKSNNAERQAFGTTNEDILNDMGVSPSDNQNYTRNKSADIVVYYDMTSHAWRSFIRSNITLIYDESY